MRKGVFLLALLVACDKDKSSSGASSEPAATATVSAAAAAAAPPGVAAVGTPGAGAGATTTDSGVTIANDAKGKRVDVDGGTLALKNDSGSGTVSATDAGTVLRGKDGKTLTIPPIPGMK